MTNDAKVSATAANTK